MTDLNHVCLIGRLTRTVGEDDVSFTYINSGTAKAILSVAVNRSVKKNDQWIDEVSYFEVILWGKSAQNLKPYLTKGKQLSIEGSLKQDRWEKDGQKMSKVVINATSVNLLGGKDSGKVHEANGKNYQKPEVTNESDEVFQEDIPF